MLSTERQKTLNMLARMAGVPDEKKNELQAVILQVPEYNLAAVQKLIADTQVTLTQLKKNAAHEAQRKKQGIYEAADHKKEESQLAELENAIKNI